jgi:hypothetical protein
MSCGRACRWQALSIEFARFFPVSLTQVNQRKKHGGVIFF